MSICLYACMSVCTYVCWMNVCLFVCYVCMHVYLQTCVCPKIHTHTHDTHMQTHTHTWTNEKFTFSHNSRSVSLPKLTLCVSEIGTFVSFCIVSNCSNLSLECPLPLCVYKPSYTQRLRGSLGGIQFDTETHTPTNWIGWCFYYRQSHVLWHFRKLFPSSKFKTRTSLFTETWQKRRSSFELWALKHFRKCHPKWDRLYSIVK